MPRSIPPTADITTSLTRFQALKDTYQWVKPCAHLEEKAVVCYESYGFGSAKCQDYITDLRECVYGEKKNWRVGVMRCERIRQYKEGTSKELYAPSPPDNAY